MAWPRNTNRSRLPDPEYNSQGKAHAIINYSERNHMVQTERAFGVLRVSDDYYKLHSPPPLANVLQGGNIDDIPYFPPVMTYIGSPKKPGEFSPKEDRSLNPLARVKRSPFSRDDDHSNADESDDDYTGYSNYKNGDDWNPRNEGSYVPRVVRPNRVYDADYGKESPRGNPNSTSFSSSNNRVSPRRSRPEGDHTQPSRANLHPSFKPTSVGHPRYSSTSPKKEKQYERPIGHTPLIRTTKPESLDPTIGGHPRYNSTSPKNDTQYEKPIGYTPFIEKKPEPDIDYASQSPKALRKYPSHYETTNNIKPEHERPNRRVEGRQQVIDSKEAAKRYGDKGKPFKGQIYEEEYRGTIDCREAAARYNGIFVPSGGF